MVCSVVDGSPAGVKFTANLVDSRQLTFRCELTAEYMATLASGFSGLPLAFYGELLTPVLIPDQSQIGSSVIRHLLFRVILIIPLIRILLLIMIVLIILTVLKFPL